MTPINDLAIFIPARSGSKRLFDKNARLIGGKPLLGIAIEKALQIVGSQGVFVSTESKTYADMALSHGAMVPSLRPDEFASDTSTDIEWLTHALSHWRIEVEFICILRPTSPLVTAASILTAFRTLKTNDDFDSIRAVRKVAEHPGKMWRKTRSSEIIPLFPQIIGETPSHSRPTQSLESIYVQCGAFEISRRASVLRTKSIAGNKILGHFLEQPESLDINTLEDLLLAEILVQTNNE